MLLGWAICPIKYTRRVRNTRAVVAQDFRSRYPPHINGWAVQCLAIISIYLRALPTSPNGIIHDLGFYDILIAKVAIFLN